MKIGFMQWAPVLGDATANMETIKRLSDSCVDADLIVLPELCNTGYNFESREQAWALSETTDGSYLKFIRGICARQDQHIVTGFNERDGGTLYNSAALVGPDGVIGVYRKMHLFMNEKDIFAPGDTGLPIFEIKGVKVGILICFDWVFPEAWRVLALQGAEIICHPSNLAIPGKAQRAVPIQALMNGVYVVLANRFGTERELTFTGNSLISGPRGDVLVEAPAGEEAVGLTEIDPAAARNKSITARNDLLADRRPEEYTQLCTRR